MKKRIFVALICALLVLAVFPVSALAEDGTYVVTFNSAKIVGNQSNNFNGGAVFFGTSDLSAEPANVRIVLVGKNEFSSYTETSYDSAVRPLVAENCDLEISGSGSLELGVSGLYSLSAVYFSNVSLTVNSGTVSVFGRNEGIYVSSANITVNGGSVSAAGENTSGITLKSGSLTVNDGTVSASGRNTGIMLSNGKLIINGGKVSGTSEEQAYVSCGIDINNAVVNSLDEDSADIILNGGTLERIAEVNGDDGRTYGIRGSILMKSGKLVAEVPALEEVNALDLGQENEDHAAISPAPDFSALTDYRWSVEKGLMQKGPIPEDTVIGDYFAISTLAEGGKHVPYSPVHQITSAIETSAEENPNTGALDGTAIAACGALVALSTVALVALRKNKKTK